VYMCVVKDVERVCTLTCVYVCCEGCGACVRTDLCIIQ
jgi:hypothetical protein